MDWSTFLQHTFTNFLFTIGFLVVAGFVWILTEKESDDDHFNF